MIPLVVRGWLRDGAGGWVADPQVRRCLSGHRVADRMFGIMAAPHSVRRRWKPALRGMRPGDLKTLTSEPVRSLYVTRHSVVPALRSCS